MIEFLLALPGNKSCYYSMCLKTTFRALILLVFLARCGAPKVLTSYKNDAITAGINGNYVQAVDLWKQFFNQQTIGKIDIPAEDYARAAKAAFRSNLYNQAIQWFDQARFGGYADPEMYLDLAAIYKSMDNLSKELTALEFINSNYHGCNDSAAVRNRLFNLYLEANDPEKAVNIWNLLPSESKKDESYLDNYFRIFIKKGDKEKCDSIANTLLEINPGNVPALEWNAKKYYRLGEERYQAEMEKYNKNKTNRQYQLLLKELDLVTADFKKALTWFDALWKIEPGEKYAPYLATIYARFGNKEKADYYQSFVKK